MQSYHDAQLALLDPKLREAFAIEQFSERVKSVGPPLVNTPASRKAAKRLRRRRARGLKTTEA